MKRPSLSLAWHFSEFGGMGIEGAVRLGYRDQIKEDPEAFQRLVDMAYEKGRAYSIASMNEFDDIIEPAMTRRVLINAIESFSPLPSFATTRNEKGHSKL